MDRKEPFEWLSITPSQFEAIVQQVREAIAAGILPQRIGKGSSGAYFVRDLSGGVIGVFKPRDEEPYSRNNPNWRKWLQRICFPCIFGRSCLLENGGYVCEAAASQVDQILRTKLVPFTAVVHLASPTFNYTKAQRKACAKQATPLPEKPGSLQLFVRGFEDAGKFLCKFSTSLTTFNSQDKVQKAHFLFEFQKLVILDYVIRNTDRGMDNWLLAEEKDSGYVKIAAIDHGLSFPHRHPSKCRSYPFSWGKTAFAKEAFTEEVKSIYLPLLSDMQTWERLEATLHATFSLDVQFNEQIFQQQMGVMRGQLMNLVAALEAAGKTPLDLIRMPRIVVHKQILSPSTSSPDSINSTLRKCKYRLKKILVKANPCFSCW